MMVVEIMHEDRFRADVRIRPEQWRRVRPVLVSLKGGGQLTAVIDQIARPHRPVLIQLPHRDLNLLEAAAARLPD